MFMVTLQISKFVDFTETRKSRYLQNETVFFLQIRKSINYTSTIKGYFMAKVSFAAEVTFNSRPLAFQISFSVNRRI